MVVTSSSGETSFITDLPSTNGTGVIYRIRSWKQLLALNWMKPMSRDYWYSIHFIKSKEHQLHNLV